MKLPLTKTLHPADLVDLNEELQIVDEHFTKDSPQHEMRRWEYALALRAHQHWTEKPGIVGGPVYDVGGSGSPFYRMLDPYNVHVVDPKEHDGKDLAQLLREGARLGAAVFCLSTIEHVDDLDQFIYHLGCLTAPGGLLFLTMDFGIHAGTEPDPFHFHWMRQRIFTAESWLRLSLAFARQDCALFGSVDWTYHGPTVYDYTFASLCLRKRS
jgi:hypothetical protein